MNIPKLTLDTNLLMEIWRDQSKKEIVLELISLKNQGKVDLAVTARINEDIPNPPLNKKIHELSSLGIEEIGSITRLGFWVLGRDMLGSDRFNDFNNKWDITAKKKHRRNPGWEDWDHLHAHYLKKRDYFLTWDKAILSLQKELKGEFGIVILTPEEYLKHHFQTNQ